MLTSTSIWKFAKQFYNLDNVVYRRTDNRVIILQGQGLSISHEGIAFRHTKHVGNWSDPKRNMIQGRMVDHCAS